MTPAILLLKKHKIVHEVLKYHHDGDAPSYGLEASDKLGLDANTVFKTLIAELDTKELVVGLVPVSDKLNTKALAKAAGVKKAAMANPERVERSSGYVLGGVSPLGQKKALRTFIHDSAESLPAIHVSAGRRGLEIKLAPTDLQRLTRAQFSPLV
ncbi:Cys-tRNA(Pro) deacylase [Alteromonas sp. C1M14]|uniref:Cys-tRNA(Pro) deacylase n=1 Tax=Alteromonas sp. C1M14 TaxID=2841567 RepID=UPI001C089A3A|nr:Cys-tRNA(Pro) deacylase [Alteromonas sp. C1M14]MBU2978956.1 Cys-tRNA(Pro) deacylase [Alteromonas sp. C1M14]